MLWIRSDETLINFRGRPGQSQGSPGQEVGWDRDRLGQRSARSGSSGSGVARVRGRPDQGSPGSGVARIRGRLGSGAVIFVCFFCYLSLLWSVIYPDDHSNPAVLLLMTMRLEVSASCLAGEALT